MSILSYIRNKKNGIPFTLDYAGVPVVTLMIDNHTFQFMIDTGSSHSSIMKRVPTQFNMPIQDLKGSGVSFNGITDHLQYCGLVFHFNDIFYVEAFMIIPEQQEYALKQTNASAGCNIVGLLGSDFLKKYGWVIDYHKKVIYNKCKKERL